MASNKGEKSSFSIRKLIYNDKYLIAFSIIAAIAIWIATSMNLSPETTKKLTVPVSVDLSGTLAEQLGIEYFDSKEITVEVTVSCKKYLAKDISENDINAYLQTSTITSTGYHSVPIIVMPEDGAEFTISSFYPTSAEGYYDIAVESTFPVELNFTNNDFTADGYVSGTTTLSEEQVSVKGPKSYVSQVSKVVATVELGNDLTESQLVDLNPVAVDSSGNRVDYVSIGSDITANIPILKVQNLQPKVSFINAPLNADTIFDIDYSVNSIEAGVLDSAGITELVLGDIDFSTVKQGANEFVFDITNLNGIIVLDGTSEITVTVTVPDDYETKTISLSRNDVSLNTPDGYSSRLVSLSESRITVIGTADAIERIEKANLVVTCDLNQAANGGISEGTKSYALNVSVKDASDVWVYGEYTASVNVSK